jgi:arsenite methyltransferase
MKNLLDWKDRSVVQVFDEVTLWSAPFGRLLLENMPMKAGATVVDVGFGTGFPLIELSQRFGKHSRIIGIDIWEEAIRLAKQRIERLEIENIELLEASATAIDIGDGQVDLVTSNLGVNNFEEKEKIYSEIRRILKKGGRLCITTNPIGTFQELFELFDTVLNEMELQAERKTLSDSIQHRNTEQGIIAELEKADLQFVKSKSDTTNFRFVDGEALLDHSLIRIGFREYWEEMIPEGDRSEFFERVVSRIDAIVEREGTFSMKVPILYLEFGKEEPSSTTL